MEAILRVGSAGGMQEHVHLRDIVLGQGACTDSAYSHNFGLPGTYAPIASWRLLELCTATAKSAGLPYHVGNLLSSDIFYNDSADTTERWKKMGVLAVEMEAAALYMNAARAGKHALAICCLLYTSTVVQVLRDMGAREVIVISRRGEDNYENLDRHADAGLLVNTTPVGMYPSNGTSPVDLTRLPGLRCVVDIIYNPAKTALMLQAQSLGIPAVGGLAMLVAQAKYSADLFTGNKQKDAVMHKIQQKISGQMKNLSLIHI